MPPKQRMRIASKSHSQNVNLRGNVPKSQVTIKLLNFSSFYASTKML